MYMLYTGKNMLDLICKPLSALYDDRWQTKLMGIGTDGIAGMIRRLSGTIVKFDNACNSTVYRIWYGTHQLLLVSQAVLDVTVKRDSTHR